MYIQLLDIFARWFYPFILSGECKIPDEEIVI